MLHFREVWGSIISSVTRYFHWGFCGFSRYYLQINSGVPSDKQPPTLKFKFVFWDVLPYKIIVGRRFRGTCCLHHQGPLKRRSTIILHGSTSQKTNLNFILAAVRTWILTSTYFPWLNGRMWQPCTALFRIQTSRPTVKLQLKAVSKPLLW
jgi:hypothetical protein